MKDTEMNIITGSWNKPVGIPAKSEDDMKII
jgi:hypothetical protein